MPKNQVQNAAPQNISVGFNAGNTMLILSQDYATVKKVIDELLQNAIDANAKTMLISINLKAMSISAFDDGYGCSKSEFINRVQNIGERQKDEGQQGKYGTGNLAPLGIMGDGGTYQFISRPISVSSMVHPFFMASIDYDTIHNSKDVSFTFKDLPNHTYTKYCAPIDVSRMTTHTKCTGIQKSAMKSWLKDDAHKAARDLCEYIGSGKYAPKIKDKDITVNIVPKEGGSDITDKVIISEFNGRKEDPILIKTPYGPAEFEVYTTYTQVPDPVFKIRHKGVVDIDMRGMDIWEVYKDVFGSGYMQGYIHIGFCEVNAERNDLLWSDERDALVEAIKQYTNEYASEWLDDAKRKREINHHKELAKRAVSSVDSFLRENPTLLSPDFCGAISDGHSDVSGKKVKIGKQSTPRSDGDSDDEELPKVRSKKERGERKNIIHVSADSPDGKGSDRDVVRGQSGVSVKMVEPNSDECIVWRKMLDSTGVIRINIDHKDFVKCHLKGDSSEVAYIKALVIGAITEKKIYHETGEAASIVFKDGYEDIALIGIVAH